MPKRSEKRDTAKAEYVKRRRSGEKINLKEFAAMLGVIEYIGGGSVRISVGTKRT